MNHAKYLGLLSMVPLLACSLRLGGSTAGGPGDAGGEAASAPPSFAFQATNVDLASLDFGGVGDVVVAQNCDVDLDNGSFCDAPNAHFQKVVQSSGSAVGVFTVRSLRIEQGATLHAASALPLVIVAADTIDVVGTINVAANGMDPGAGGFGGTTAGLGAGPGGGTGWGGAGSYCGVGGAGPDPTAVAGKVYGNPEIAPLIGGSAGGDGETVASGGGGGAVQLVAGSAVRVAVTGIVHAGGGGSYAQSGAGSGGAILIESQEVDVAGVLAANGGGGAADALPNDQPASGGTVGGQGSAGATIDGAPALAAQGGGGGGAGRIRLNAKGSANVTGVLSPSLGTPCATEGVLQ
jgi:hypothetical protein